MILLTADVFLFSTHAVGDHGKLAVRADRRMFFPPAGANLKTRQGIQSARGVATWGDQLIVSDIGRLMFWNGLDSLKNGQPADGIIGDESFYEVWPACCGRIKVDTAGRLWVLGFEGLTFLDVYRLALTEYSVPIHTIHLHDIVLPVQGMRSKVTFKQGVQGIAPVEGGKFLWISDVDNHRVLRIRDPLTDPKVDVVLGQKDVTGAECNQGRFAAADLSWIEDGRNLDVLCFPGALSLDRMGNLYVSDHALEINGNQRLLAFHAETFNSETPADDNARMIFGPQASSAFVRTGKALTNRWVEAQAEPLEGREIFGEPGHLLTAATWEPAFDSANRMVVGYNAYAGPRFLGVYDDPLGPSRLPDGYLHDFTSMPFAAAFDEKDNLYVGDINRGTVLVYKDPFDRPAMRGSVSNRTGDAQPPPVPQNPMTIEAVSPAPPHCVLRNSRYDQARTLGLTVTGLGLGHGPTLEFRRVTDDRSGFLDINTWVLEDGKAHIRVGRPSVWGWPWSEREIVTLTARIVERRRHPACSWRRAGPPRATFQRRSNGAAAFGTAGPAARPGDRRSFPAPPSPLPKVRFRARANPGVSKGYG